VQSSGSTALWTLAAQASEAQALCQVSDGYETVAVTRAIPVARQAEGWASTDIGTAGPKWCNRGNAETRSFVRRLK
jgi:hypothetical protein